MYKRPIRPDELYHYGVLGMHWGVRRYQNYDGTRIGTGGAPVTDSTKKAGSSFRESIAGGQGGKATGNARLAAQAPRPHSRLNMISTSAAAKAADAVANAGKSKNDSNGDSGDKEMSTAEKIFSPTLKKGKDKEKTSVAQDVTKSALRTEQATKDVVNILKDADPKVKKEQEKIAQDAKKMSDKELRDSINRIKMEREYQSLKSDEIDSGYNKVTDFLEKAEPFIKIAVEVAGLIAIIAKLKHSATADDINEVYLYCKEHDFDDEIITHAVNFELEELIDDFGLDYDEVMHAIEDSDNELYHYGVLGMKWGVRRYQNYDGTRIGTGGSPVTDKARKASNSFRGSIAGGQGGKATGNAKLAAKMLGPKKSEPRSDGKDESKFTPEQKRISKDAANDAKEFARAKAFYGEGAGNRRKAIKTTVEAKKKKSSFYAEEFEYHLSQQDMEEHMRQAKMERSQKDTAIGTKKALRKANRALGQLSYYL